MQMIAYPFRFGPDKRVVTVDSASTAGTAQRLGQIVMTQRGERGLRQQFGVRSTSWNRLTLAEIRLAAAIYGPFGVSLSGLDTNIDETKQKFVLRFQEDTQ